MKVPDKNPKTKFSKFKMPNQSFRSKSKIKVANKSPYLIKILNDSPKLKFKI